MLTFLFWNLKRARDDILANLVRRYAVDVLMLAECPLGTASVLKALNPRRGKAEYYGVHSECPRVALYTRFPDQYAPQQGEGRHYTIRRIELPSRTSFLLCVVHFPSKLHNKSDADPADFAKQFSSKVLAPAEMKAGHGRTILAGDLNMNPYEDGMVVSTGLHAVMTREIAQRGVRTVKLFTSNVFFYNPMWRHFGQRPERHAGTYYLENPGTRADYWNVYDQVLIRPELLPYFRDEDLEIIHRDSDLDVSFLRQGKPDREEISDHLPILFRLRI